MIWSTCRCCRLLRAWPITCAISAATKCHRRRCGTPVARLLAAIKRFVREQGIDLIRFQRGERKDDRTQDYLRRWSGGEGVLFVGVAQEKARVRTVRRRRPNSEDTYPWLMASTAYVNYYYCYLVDEDFGPLFIKFCSYFPFNAKLCLNGHEYLKRQLAREGIAFEALDNGILSCADPQRMQELADGLTAGRIEALLRKWLERLPHPFSSADRLAGLHRSCRPSSPSPRCSTVRCTDVPGVTTWIWGGTTFDRRINKRTPSRFRTSPRAWSLAARRLQALAPSSITRARVAHRDDINDSYDFAGRRPLDQLGFATNRRRRPTHQPQLRRRCL